MQRSVDDFDPRVGALLDEYLAAAQKGAAPDREAFLAAHAEVAEDLRTALAGFEFIERAENEVAAVASDRDEALERGTLGDFRIVREAGRGGMGVVYEAEQISLGRRVALKVLPFAAVLDERQLQRFKHEAQSAALLHHTNIVPIYSVGTERGVHYYAMEFVEGRTLAAVIGELRSAARAGRPSSGARARERRPSPRSADRAGAAPDSSAEAAALTPEGTTESPAYCRAVARLGVQAAEALEHAHQNGVVHRDIKPANLLVDARGHLWIADFGLARSRVNTNLTMTGAIVGTLGYMSPEQALGKHVTLDHRTDVYSLGVTLIEALTLEPAFAGDDPRRVIQDIAFREPARPRRLNAAVSPALETILLKAVAKDPETRYATAQEMADDLRRFLDEKPVLARRTPIVDRAALWARRHRAAVVAAAAVLVVAVVALAASTVSIAASKQRAEEANEKTEAALAESKRAEARTRDALAESRDNAQRAEVNFGKALEAVDLMLSRVGDERLKGVPGMEPVRRKLLEDAVLFYRGFLKEEAASGRVGIETVRADERLAQICRDLGDTAAALQSIDSGEAVLRTLLPTDGSWSPFFHDVVDAGLLRGRVLIAENRKAAAVVAFESAQAVAELNLRERPDDPHFATCLATVEFERGTQLIDLCRFKEAEAALDAALALIEARITRAPDDAKARGVRSDVEYMLAELLFALGRPADGEVVAKKALSHCEQIDADGRADILQRLGGNAADFGRFDEAVTFLRDAASIRSRLAAESPRFPLPGAEAAGSAASLARVLRLAGRDQDAKVANDEAVRCHERFLTEFEGVAEAREQVVEVLLGLANLLEVTERRPEAEPLFRRAIDLRRAIASDAPGDLVALGRLADTLEQIGSRDELDPKAAATLLQASVNARDTLIDRCPDVARYRSDQETVLGNLAIALEGSGDNAGAAVAYHRGIKMIRELVAETPARTAYRRDLATHLLNFGALQWRTGELAAAAAALSESATLLEAIVAETSGDPEVQAALGAALANRGLVETQQRRLTEAEATLGRALEIRESMVRRLPRSRLHRGYLAGNYMYLGDLLVESGRAAESEPYWVRAAAVCRALAAEDPSDLESRRRLRWALGRIVEIRHAGGRAVDTEEPLRELVRASAELAEASPTLASRRELLQHRGMLAQHLRDVAPSEEADRIVIESVGLVEAWERADPVEYRSLLGSVLWNLGVWYTTSRRDREAVQIYERLIVREPARYSACHNLVLQLGDSADPALRNRTRAVELAQQAVEVTSDPADAREARALLGFALICNGEWKEGIASYAKAAELSNGAFTDVECGSDLAYVALAHARLGQMQDAREWFAKLEGFVSGALSEDDLDRERILRRRAEVAELLGPTDAK